MDGLIVVFRNHVHHLEVINHYVRIQKLVILILVFGKIIHVNLLYAVIIHPQRMLFAIVRKKVV